MVDEKTALDDSSLHGGTEDRTAHARTLNEDSSGGCDPEDCPVCIAAHTVEGHFTQSAATTSSDANNSDGLLGGDRGYSLVYKPTSQLKIFLSLQQRGHSVWVDTERLSAGIDWEDGINSALARVREAQRDGRVLLLMTPHALRRPDGYCLNEIARAVQNRLNIFPVMVADSDPAPSISTLPFFDLRQCVPTEEEELRLDARGHPWLDLMKDHVHSPLFQEKSQRLFAVLELFESMLDYGVPAVAGVENLGLFPQRFDDTHPERHDSRGKSLRRLIAQTSFGSARSLDLGHSLPTTPHEAGSESCMLTDATDDTTRDSHQNQRHSLVPVDNLETTDIEPSGKEDAFKTRYIFSFDDSCYLLAKQLHDDLAASGFSVFPPPRPSPSKSMESIEESAIAHEETLQWAAAEQNGKMILLVTPESVGRPNGACLNDISAAMSKGIGFVPLMVRQCEIPLSICRIQWLDMSDCLIYQALSSGSSRLVESASINDVRYSIRKDQLVTALKGKLDHEGQQARLSSLLPPLSFQQQISKLTSRFTGRGWFFEQLTRWIESPAASQVFWVTGQIGSGKTALAARLVQTIPEIAAFHFALQEDEQTQNARRCVLSLAYQLTTQLPQYAHFLQSREPLEEIVPISNFNTLVTRLLVEPLNDIARPQSTKPSVLLIDGLEHLAASNSASSPMERPSLGRSSGSSFGSSMSEECLVSALPSLVSRLPSWVRVILLSRNDPVITAKLQNFTPNIVLDHFKKENQEDIKSYIEKTLCASPPTPGIYGTLPPLAVAPGTSLRTDLPPPGKISADQMDFIVNRSEGLFLYAVNIVQAIEEKRLAVDQLESLPIGMGGYLHQFFDSHFDRQTYKESIVPVLEILCAAFEPLSLPLISSIMEWDAYKQQEIALSFGSLLFVGADANIRPFHSSVLDWVQNRRSAGEFYVDVALGHGHIGRWAAKEYKKVARANRNDFVNLECVCVLWFALRSCQAQGEECIKLVGEFASDEKFQLARRLCRLRSDGLESFFHGKIERDESEAQLKKNLKPGSFLIRYSLRKQCYCASFIESVDPRTNKPKITHNLFHHLPSGAYSTVPPNEMTDTTVQYPDLVSFVECYQKKGILKEAIPREGPLNRAISSVK